MAIRVPNNNRKNNRKMQREAPRGKDARPKHKGSGVYSSVGNGFGGDIAKKGKQVLEKDDKPTYAPKPGDPKEEQVRNLIEATKNAENSDDVPTFVPGSKRRPTPAEISKEEVMLDSGSKVSEASDSFAPPPSIPDIGEISKLEEEGTTHTVIAKKRYKKSEKTQLQPVKRNLRTGLNEYDETG